MATPEQLVDALLSAHRNVIVIRDLFLGDHDAEMRANAKDILATARATLLAAMGGDAVPVAWRFEFRTHPGASWGRLYSTNHPGEECNVARNIEPLFALPPTPSAIAEGARWRHKKRGSTYVEVGRAELQCNKLRGFSEGDTIVVYRCEADGKLWARPADEFEDGRFEPLPPAPGEGPVPDDGHHFPNL